MNSSVLPGLKSKASYGPLLFIFTDEDIKV